MWNRKEGLLLIPFAVFVQDETQRWLWLSESKKNNKVKSMNHRSEYIMTTRKKKCAQKRSVLRTKGLFLLITDGVLKINTSFSRKELDSPILRLLSLCLSSLSHKTLMPKHSKKVLWGLLCIFSEVLEALKKWQSISVFRYPMGKHWSWFLEGRYSAISK